MGKDFHSVTVFLRVCCTMIHGFHAVGRYMHCVCTHSFVVCVLLHCRIQVFFRCSSMFDQCNILNFQAFPTLCLHFSAALPGSSLMLPLRLPFLVRSCHRHPPKSNTFPLLQQSYTLSGCMPILLSSGLPFPPPPRERLDQQARPGFSVCFTTGSSLCFIYEMASLHCLPVPVH